MSEIFRSSTVHINSGDVPGVKPSLKSDSAAITLSTAISNILVPEDGLFPLLTNSNSHTRFAGYGFQRRIARIQNVRKKDKDVDCIISVVSNLLNKESALDRESLSNQLKFPTSAGTQVISAYIQWVGHRGPKPEAENLEQQQKARELNPALLKVRVSALIDLILSRIVSLDLPIPEKLKVEFDQKMLAKLQEGNHLFELHLGPGSKEERDKTILAVNDLLVCNGFSQLSLQDGHELSCSLNKQTALKLLKLKGIESVSVEVKIAESFLDLFQGGAARIQTRADTWFINDNIEELYETEKALILGGSISTTELLKGIWSINQLDGGTPVGYQKPLRDSDTRITEAGVISYQEIPTLLNSSSLILSRGDSLGELKSREGCLNIVQQSPAAQRAISRMEQKILSLAPESLELAESLDVLKTYSASLLYDANRLWRSLIADRLLEISVTEGSSRHREAAINFLNEGIEHTGTIISSDRTDNFRAVYMALSNLVLSREHWDEDTLDFIFEKLDCLQRVNSPYNMSSLQSVEHIADIVTKRREDIPDASKLLEAVRDPSSAAKVIEFASYQFKLEIKAETVNELKGKILQIEFPATKLKEDTEALNVIRRISELAEKEGFDAVQLVRWPYNPAKRVRASGEYLEVKMGRDSVNNTELGEWVFIKSLSPKPEAQKSITRTSFEDYMQSEFLASQNLDLSAESQILGTEAYVYKQKHGAKAMGLEVLKKLIEEFRDPRLQTLPYVTAKVEELREGLELPVGIAKETVSSNKLICRSNAAFEYGCPPGVLDSVGLVPVPKDGVLKIDLSKHVSSFNYILESYGLDQRVSYQVLIQQQLFPRASGIVYSSFSGNSKEPTLIEASVGPSISATHGLGNVVQYRLTADHTMAYRNFEGSVPAVIFVGDRCIVDASEDLSRRELELYSAATSTIEAISQRQIEALWKQNTFPIASEPCSPLKQEELDLLHKFAKFAEGKLGKAIKLEFGIDSDGCLLLHQLDPAMLKVDESKLTFSNEDIGIIVETPFVNMPLHADGLEVVVETASEMFTKIPKSNFVFVSQTTPLNINILRELTIPYPQCEGVIAASGSRMNHTHSDARTYIPFLGCLGISDKLREACDNVMWGHNPNLKIDIRSDGRTGRIRIYNNEY